MNLIRIVLAALTALALVVPTAIAAAPTVHVAMDKPAYGAADLVGEGATGTVLVLDAEGHPIADAPVLVVVLHIVPLVGVVRSTSFQLVTDDAGVATFSPPTEFMLPGNYRVGAWATVDGVEHLGQTEYAVGA